MNAGSAGSFGARLKALREAAGFTQEELATIAGLSVHAVSALERGHRRRPHVDTVRALAAALDLTAANRDALVTSARTPAHNAAADELSGVSLPLSPTALLGREAEMQTLRDWIADPSARLITLTGPGGVGKTRLALELARTQAGDGACRVLFVELGAIRHSTLVAAAIAEAFGIVDANALGLPARVRAACDGGATLLVLDNFEQVLDAATLVVELLTSVAVLRVLVTSRAPLRVRGEREFAVGPLALDLKIDQTSPADLARSPAVRLFVDRVRDVQPAFRLTSANGPAVTAICRRLDALPLAIELAAPWIKVLTAEDLLRRLMHDVLLSTAGARDLPERQQTINATVAWSYHLLTPEEQQVFRRLGALPHHFSIEAAAAVVGGRDGSPAGGDDALRVVAGLIDKSLLLRAETSFVGRPMYLMLETVRAFAALELTTAGEHDDAVEGLNRYCAGEAALALEGLAGPAQPEWLHRVRDDLENHRATLAWLIERDRPVEAAVIACSLMAFWLMRGHVGEGLEWYEKILSFPSLPRAAESRALLGAALMRYTRGELEAASAALARAVAIAREAGDSDLFVTADNLLGHVESAAGNVDSARERFTRSVEAFGRLNISWGVGNALGGLALVALATGDAREAERLLIEATAALRSSGAWFLTPITNLRAILAAQRGLADEAIALVRENLTRIRELQDKFAFVYALAALASAAVLKGDAAWAARILGAADSVTERTGALVVNKPVQEIRNEAERQARARLGPDRWARVYAAGRNASIDSLMNEIDGGRT